MNIYNGILLQGSFESIFTEMIIYIFIYLFHFFIFSSTDGHLSCSHIFIIVNKIFHILKPNKNYAIFYSICILFWTCFYCCDLFPINFQFNELSMIHMACQVWMKGFQSLINTYCFQGLRENLLYVCFQTSSDFSIIISNDNYSKMFP